MTSSSVVWSLAPFAMMALGSAPQVDTTDPSPPTAIEQALIERACSVLPSSSAADSDAHLRCVNAQLLLLRGDFGRDLRRLSGTERSTLDAACSRLQTTHGREGYLDCLNAQLIALRNRRHRANRAAAEPAPLAAPAPSAPPPDAPPPQQASSRLSLIIGGVLATIAVIAASGLVVLRGRRARRTCRECGAAVPDSGDLCSTCRHAAAEALRKAATERLAHERAADQQERKQRALEEEHRRLAARQEEDTRLREREEARQREEAARRQAEEALRERQATAAAHDVEEAFDPYAVLGVPRDTSPEQIRAAYEEARSKYDQDNVAHLGVDIQEHFKAKAQAVDRAYQMLAG